MFQIFANEHLIFKIKYTPGILLNAILQMGKWESLEIVGEDRGGTEEKCLILSNYF